MDDSIVGSSLRQVMPIGGSSIRMIPFLFTLVPPLGGMKRVGLPMAAMSAMSCRSIFRWVAEVLAATLPLTLPSFARGIRMMLEIVSYSTTN